MGRRSINTTKSGKYMNPTDQARKEARKKELKKNKRQRQMVRAAVLKGKDPAQILEEMEKIDEMEYNVYQPSPLNEKVLREKRKKLKETFDRVMRLYHNDDPELWADLKRKEVEYEKKRLKKQQYFESVKSAQSVQIDEIPLPQMTTPGQQPGATPLPRVPPPNVLNFPPLMPPAPPGATVKRSDPTSHTTHSQKIEKRKKEAPGCPPGPPPNLITMRELDSDAEEEEIPLPISVNKKNAKSDENIDISNTEGRKNSFSSKNIDEFMKEIEDVHRQRENELDESDSDKSSDEGDDDEKKFNDENKNSGTDESNSEESGDEEEDNVIPEKGLSIPLPPIPPPPPAMGTLPGGPPPPPIGMPPSMMQFRPPPMRPGVPPNISGVRMQGPPVRPGMGMPQRLGIRMPPGPPPGMPPNRMMHHHQKGHHNAQQQQQQLQQKPDSKGVTTITAKPQIRNLSADVTRFVPSALRVKRDDQKLQKRPKPYPQEIKQNEAKTGATKDDAYMQFMQEMQGLL
ncbi:WW domain-binding protein 11 [Condylostylus longicornis]|uniref:WW domain-binding protein 11 n=1 Tax=Condylostylus longicornis TaxID=2530218 RepID=UPI00244E3129|nr:WW domain-binding protein 11 [Condylostylus longicornis]